MGERDGLLRRCLGDRVGISDTDGLDERAERDFRGRRRDLVCFGVGAKGARLGKGKMNVGMDEAKIVTVGVTDDGNEKLPPSWSLFSTLSALGCRKSSSGSIDMEVSGSDCKSSLSNRGDRDFRGRGPAPLDDGSGNCR